MTDQVGQLCPVCRVALVARNHGAHPWLFCPSDHGLALGEQALREHLAGHDDLVGVLFERAADSEDLGERGCPCCRLAMTLVAVTADRRALALDVCAGCHLVWFDPAELRRLEVAAERGRGEVNVFARLARTVLKAFGPGSPSE